MVLKRCGCLARGSVGVCHRGTLWDDISVWGAGPKARMGVGWVRYCSQTKLAEPEDV